MSNKNLSSLNNIELVVRDHNKFKIKLGIGENAYRSLKVAKNVQMIWEMKVVATSGATTIASPWVASTFFANSGGLLAKLGFAGAATTPVGWVIAAAIASGGAYYGIMSLANRFVESRVESIPKFINSPIDFLGATLFDLIGGLSLKMAMLSDGIDDKERAIIVEYFQDVWGLDNEYLCKCLPILEDQVRNRNLKDMVKTLAEYQLDNPDCNPVTMKKDVLELLSEIALSDGEISEREEIVLELVERELNTHLSLTTSTLRTVSRSISEVQRKTEKVYSAISDKAHKGVASASKRTSKLLKKFNNSAGKLKDNT